MGCAESREKSEMVKEKKSEPETVANRETVRDTILKEMLNEKTKSQDLPQYQVKNKGTSEDIINSLKDNWEIMHTRVEKRCNLEIPKEESSYSPSENSSQSQHSSQKSEILATQTSNPENFKRGRTIKIFTNIFAPGMPIRDAKKYQTPS